jgi:hypothetical protein
MLLTEEPVPLSLKAYSDFCWPVEFSSGIERYKVPHGRSFVDVYESRRSIRELKRVPLDLLAGALLFALEPRWLNDADALKRTKRPSVSAGALHPISVILFFESDVYLVNAGRAELDRLLFPEQKRRHWIEKCHQVMPKANGAFLVLIADIARPEIAYENFESLLLRDAGALLQTIGLVAELFGLGFCPMGVLGTEVANSFDSNNKLWAVGTGAIGGTV